MENTLEKNSLEHQNKSGLKKLVDKIGLQQLIILIVLFLIYGFFSMMSPAFRSTSTLTSILDASYYVGFLALGVTFVIITGGIDLSIGTNMMCAAITGGVIYNQLRAPLWVALLAILAVATFFGLVNGILVAKLRLPAFIATLGTMMITRGLSSIVSNVQTETFPLRGGPDGWYKSIFRTAGNFPTGVILLIVMAILATVILMKTKLGRYIFAIGSNREATRLSGINIVKVEASTYVIAGFFAGLAAIAYAATYTTVMPGGGSGFELDAIAAVVVGGTSLAGGVGSILGTVIGVFIMTVLKVGLPYIDLQPHYQIFITGFVVILAVYIDIYRNKKLNK
ncbi:ABC transporter permease [Vagococcus carniphilus]|uniref:Ribose ABC transporter permease n=1 Tax=Vagococcus carniphilus TaxID=218144 RepID=A0A430B753_9ENTE|nr:ABC transporter permease [Vagococcus carniphilus]QNN72441.1 ABC transporter permease [Vagococcus carniphilus]RSU16113.1 ribose ABC transporter permease [Vagococcus carniphilus]